MDTSLLLIYSSIVAFQFHPGIKERLSPELCMLKAMDYWEAYRKTVVSEKCVQGDLWRG